MIKRYKPTSPGRRGQTRLISVETKIKTKTDKKIVKKMTKGLVGAVGRSDGKISMHHKRRGAKKLYRLIDFKRNKYDVEGTVESIEYDPNRTSDVARILYVDGERRYILAPKGLKVGEKIISSQKADPDIGNALPLGKMPVGTKIHNVELYPGAGGRFIRSAGAAGTVTAREKGYVNVKMPSGEVRKFLAKCFATIGQIGRDEWKLTKIGKAGRNYHRGIRPTTRGKARAYGHPLAGSYKRRLGRQPVDKWGNLSKGKKTRNRRHTDKYIVKDRRTK